MGLAGRPALPADKSIAHRAALVAALANGTSEIVGYGDSLDLHSTLGCLRQLGVEARWDEDSLFLEGGGLTAAADALDCGNSATTMRLLAGILAAQPFESVLRGDESLSKRPMDRVAEPLRQMGADVRLEDGSAPITILGRPLSGITYELPVASAQVKSAVLLAGLLASGETTVVETAPSRDHTERMLGIDAWTVGAARHLTVSRETPIEPGLFVVPKDFSAAAFFLVAAAIVRPSIIEMRGVGVNPTRTGLLEVLSAMGAPVRMRNVRDHRNEPIADLWLQNDDVVLGGVTVGGELIPRLIDELPVLAVAAAYARGTTVIRDAGELRLKECDRIHATTAFLAAMGANITERPDGWVIEGGQPLHGAQVSSFGDHRIAMAAAVAALGAEGETAIDGASYVDVSFPRFWDELASLAGGA